MLSESPEFYRRHYEYTYKAYLHVLNIDKLIRHLSGEQ